MIIYKTYLHTLVDLYPPVIVVIQLFVYVPQSFQTKAVCITQAWWHHYETWVYRGQNNSGQR